MVRELEFDKPLSVDCLRHLLKDFDASGVVFDKVVVGTEDGGDFVSRLWIRNWKIPNRVFGKMREYRSTR